MAFSDLSSSVVDDLFIDDLQDGDWVIIPSTDGKVVWVSPTLYGDTITPKYCIYPVGLVV